MNKIYRILGKRGRVTIPYYLRILMEYKANDVVSFRVEGDEIIVTARAYARSVEIRCGADVLLSDNYFDMNAGERRVKVLRGAPTQVSARSVYDIR